MKKMLFVYFLITIIGSLLLFNSLSAKHKIKYIDAFFVSASAFSDTGLTTLTTSETWTLFGQTIISLLIIIGGIGWFSLKIFFFNIIFGKSISLTSRNSLACERGNTNIGETRELIKISIISIFTLMTIAGLTLSLHFYYSNTFHENLAVNWGDAKQTSAQGILFGKTLNPYHNWNLAIRYGVFHSISAINNAGFDIMGSHSIAPYFDDYFVQVIFLLLFIFGGIGYPVIYDIWKFCNKRKKDTKFKFSLFSKLSCITYLIVSVVGVSLTLIIEIKAVGNNAHPTFWHSKSLLFDDMKDKSISGLDMSNFSKVFALIFNTMSTRNAGFSTINFHQLMPVTLIVHSIMMFIGSAPSSTAGGIRTTTFAILIISLWSKIRGKSSTRIFNRKIPFNTVWNSYVVSAVSLFLVIFASLIAFTSFNIGGGHLKYGSTYNPGGAHENTVYDYSDILFETVSAFGTTGLSTGLTPNISFATKIMFIITMFVGQLGVSSTIFSFISKKRSSRHYKYIEEDILIG